MQPVVSIVTPSFNQAPFLEATITSVLNRLFQSGILDCGGGSTDGSQEYH
jgi:glycosyltransferase involved in cell wall biosynthesis